MSNLTIKDLETSRDLDREASSAILGGINEWIHIPTPPIPFPSMSNYNFYSIDNDITMINPQFITVGNGVQNTGSIVYNVSPMALSAASPTVVSA